MTEHELEAQCMALSNVIDTEVVSRDPTKLPSFDASTLYVWLEPARGDTHHDNRVHGRLGKRDETAESLKELAKKLGVQAGHA